MVDQNFEMEMVSDFEKFKIYFFFCYIFCKFVLFLCFFTYFFISLSIFPKYYL